MYNNVLLIPALDPDQKLIEYVKELKESGFYRIVAVDDGSRTELKYIFDALRDEYGCDVVLHEVNRGKGRALKDGIRFIEEKYGSCPDYKGIITADSDGQHTVADVIKLNCLLDSSDSPALFLGVRNFDLDFVPPKSKKGNKITTRVFRLLYGKHISDTQTGLRAISRELAIEYSQLSGERFEYETNMLICATRSGHNIVEEPIETVYHNDNSGTHFRPFADSFKIYKLLLSGFLKYTAASVVSMLLDQGLANLLFYLVFNHAFAAKAIARVVSALFNFSLNRNVVFKVKDPSKRSSQAIRYFTLAVCQLLVSAGLVYALTLLFTQATWMFTVLSIIVDVALFFVSYRIQHLWVFR